MHIKALTAVATIAVLAAGVASLGHASAQSPTTTTNSNSSQTVAVAPGDTLSGIAKKYGTTYVRLFDANPGIQNPNLIYPGEAIRIPAPGEQLADRLPSAPSAPASTDSDSDAAVGTPPVAPASTHTPSPAPAVAAATPAPTATSTPSGVWNRLAQCESGGNWSINTGNGFYGGLQFTLSSWHAVGGSGYPNQASPSEQIARAQMLEARQGWGAWPACSAKLGLR